MEIQRNDIINGYTIMFEAINKRGKVRSLPVEVNCVEGTVNVPATGDISAESTDQLIEALHVASALAKGRTLE